MKLRGANVNVIALATIGILSPAAGAETVWPVEGGGNGHSYEVVVVQPSIGWNAASAAARARGGYLASITSAAENDFVYSLIDDPQYWVPSPQPPVPGSTRYFGPWLGGRQTIPSPDPAAGWAWESGEPWSYTNWLPGQPDDFAGPSEQYLHFFGRDNTGGRTPMWNDASDPPFGGSVRAYVVEYVPEPGLATAVLGLGAVLAMRCRRRPADQCPAA